MVGGQEAELLGAACAAVGVVDDEQLACGASDRQLFPIQGELSDLRMVERDGSALAGLDVMARPERAEAVARERELADEFDKARVVGVGTDRLPESGDKAGGCHTA